ncbi:reverse transcriptase [Phytophthora megakarya]|uniref:Reverse transcriptase n=1 Tax=Phytophthora megakarya TaxID=4795 RepID=A0A225VLL7_9STRA|nr:reverse transcriptase [Phytophthora megakarya]
MVKSRSRYLENLTVNEAEYNSLLLGLDMLADLDRKHLVICGDSNPVIRQVRGEIDCKTPGLTLLERRTLDRLRKWSDHELVHVKRAWNGSADSLASEALQQQGGIEVQVGPKHQDQVTLNRLDEILIHKTENPVVRVAAVTTRAARVRSPAGVMQEDLRVNRVRQVQEEEVWITGMKKYLSGSIADLTQAEARLYGKIAADYMVDEQVLLFTALPRRDGGSLSVAETGSTRNVAIGRPAPLSYHVRGRASRSRPYLLADPRSLSLEGIIPECSEMPNIQGESPGNLQTTYPFQIIAMDHIPSLPRSNKENTELLIWVDLFTGYVIAKASSS